MARNVEIKAHIKSIEALMPVVAALADRAPATIVQEDIFFRTAEGRLKLRVISEDSGELIFYRRPDEKGPAVSEYLVSPTGAPRVLEALLMAALGETVRVRKCRTLFEIGRSRIHLDRVDGLGEFLEIEVVLSESESAGHGIDIAEQLLRQLGIEPHQLIDRAYADLLAEATAEERSEVPHEPVA